MSVPPSLTKSLRTMKVQNDAGPVAWTDVRFTVRPQCIIANNQYLMEQYGRPTPWYSSLNYEGFGNGYHGGPSVDNCISPEYRIQVENLVSRPQYSEYLNVPQGIMMTQSEYQNKPHTDAMGMNRDRAFGYDGNYLGMKWPQDATNYPDSDKAFIQTQQYAANRYVKADDNRLWQQSSDTVSGF